MEMDWSNGPVNYNRPQSVAYSFMYIVCIAYSLHMVFYAVLLIRQQNGSKINDFIGGEIIQPMIILTVRTHGQQPQKTDIYHACTHS